MDQLGHGAQGGIVALQERVTAVEADNTTLQTENADHLLQLFDKKHRIDRASKTTAAC